MGARWAGTILRKTAHVVGTYFLISYSSTQLRAKTVKKIVPTHSVILIIVSSNKYLQNSGSNGLYRKQTLPTLVKLFVDIFSYLANNRLTRPIVATIIFAQLLKK